MYQYLNVHPKGLIVGDCVKRAITLAAQMDYMEVQRELNRYKKVTGAQSFNSDYNPHKYVENVLHARKLSFPAERGKKRMTGEEFSRTHPTGRYILNMARHWSCCVDGIIYDTWDCSERCVYTAYQILPATFSEFSPKKNYYVVQNNGDCTFTVTVIDITKDTRKECVLGKSMLAGYCRCLDDLGYIKNEKIL